jgi:hypothetical protein
MTTVVPYAPYGSGGGTAVAGAAVAGAAVAGAAVAGAAVAGAVVGVAGWQATIPKAMAIAVTKDRSLNIFVDISFSFYLICREIVSILSDIGQVVEIAVFMV